MTLFAKGADRLSASLMRCALDAISAYFVHLTIAFAVGSMWALAWCQSVAPGHGRILFPALRKEDVARFIQERDGQWRARRGVTQTTVSLDGKE